jgi:hypothetical protein
VASEAAATTTASLGLSGVGWQRWWQRLFTARCPSSTNSSFQAQQKGPTAADVLLRRRTAPLQAPRLARLFICLHCPSVHIGPTTDNACRRILRVQAGNNFYFYYLEFKKYHFIFII